ncbi:MAG: PAS domain S-box protein, partial [Microcoleus sp.]
MTSVFHTNLKHTGLKVLLVATNAQELESIHNLLLENHNDTSNKVLIIARISEVNEILDAENFDAVLLNLPLPDSQEFNALLDLLKDNIDIPIVLLIDAENEEIAVELIAAGAEDYLVKTEADSRMLDRTLRCACARYKRRIPQQQSPEKYPAAVDNIKEVVFQTDTAGNWIFLNSAWTEITEYAVEESLGSPCWDCVYPEDKQQSLDRFRRLIECQEQSCCYQIRYLSKNGNLRWVEVQASLIFSLLGVVEGTTGTLNDITEKILAKQELQASKMFLNYTIDAVADPIFVKDAQHRWILLNDAFCKLIGKQRQELLGKSDYDFFSKAEAAIFWQNDEQVFRTGEEHHSEEIFTDTNGDRHLLSTKKTAFKNPDTSQNLVGIIRDITEERRQQLALQKTEARLSHLAANLPGVIYQFLLTGDGKKTILYFSSGCRELYEVTAEEVLQNADVIFNMTHPDDRQKAEESILNSAKTLQPWRHEWRVILPSGKIKWLQGLSKPERVNFPTETAQEGDIIWEGIVLDITDLKQTESALRESEERFRSLVENIPGAIYRYQFNTNWTMEFISDEIEKISGYPARYFIGDRCLSFASIIHPEDTKTVKFTVAEAVKLQQPYYVQYRIVRADGAVRWISERGRATYSKDGLLLWLDGAIFDITDRKQAELTLQQVMQAVNSASDAIAIADLDGYSIYHNQQFIHRYGYSVEELNNAGGPSVMYAKSQVLRKLFRVLRKGKSWNGEIKLRANNGELIETYLQADCIKNNDGQPIGIMAVITDLTEIKRAESALRLSQERLQLAVSGSSLGLWDWNIATSETYFDAQWKKMLGYEESEIDNNFQAWEKLLHPEDRTRVIEILKNYLEGVTDLYEVEFRLLNKIGNWQWIMSMGKVVEYDEFGAPLRMTGTNKDISARVAAEAEKTQLIASLQKLTYQLQSAQTIARLGNWELDIYAKIITWSDEVFRIFDREPGNTPCLEELRQQVHPDDRERWFGFVQRSINPGIAYDIDYRINLPSGEIKHINCKAEVVKNESGEVVKLLGTAMDITERKLAEIALQESEQRFRAVFEQAAIGIAQVRPTGEFLKVNQGFCKIVGYSAAELSMLTVWDISYPEDIQPDRESGRRMLAGEILNYSLEKRFICKNGSLVWTNVTVSLVRDAFGQPSYAIGAIEDISDRKQAEAALRQQLKRERLVISMLERIRYSLNLTEVLTNAVAEVRHFLQTDRTIIYRFNPDWSGIISVESVGESWMQSLGTVINDPCLEATYASDYKHGRVRAIDDINTAELSECYVNLLAQFQVKANLVVPIVQGDMLWGLLIAHECERPRIWEEFEIECLKQISVQLAIAIQQSMLFEQAQTEIAERKLAELALQESEARERSKALQLELAINKLRTTQSQLVQNEKMVSLGQLVAGVAHEINNPVNFIHGNLNPARN